MDTAGPKNSVRFVAGPAAELLESVTAVIGAVRIVEGWMNNKL